MIEQRLKSTCFCLTIFIVAASILLGCQPTNITSTSPSNISFTINMATGSLSVNSGFLFVQGVAIAGASLGNFLAASSRCTYDRATMGFHELKNQFIYPIDNSAFSNTGFVNIGTATRKLLLYRTLLRSQRITVLGPL